MQGVQRSLSHWLVDVVVSSNLVVLFEVVLDDCECTALIVLRILMDRPSSLLLVKLRMIQVILNG